MVTLLKMSEFASILVFTVSGEVEQKACSLSTAADIFLKRRTQYLWNLPLTLTCFDSCSLSLSSPRFEKLQPIIYLLWRFCVSEMFSCPGVTAFHAPALSLIHVITLPSAKRKEWGEREKEARFYFVWVSGLLCAWGDNTSHCHCTGWQHTHTGLTQPQVYTIVFVSILKSK